MNGPDTILPGADEPPALPPEILALMASFEAAGEAAPEPAGTDGVEAREATLVLAPVLGLTAAAALHGELLARRGAALVIDAGAVQRLGGQCLQLLLSAAVTFRRDDVPLRFGATSEAFRRDLALLGFDSPDALFREAA